MSIFQEVIEPIEAYDMPKVLYRFHDHGSRMETVEFDTQCIKKRLCHSMTRTKQKNGFYLYRFQEVGVGELSGFQSQAEAIEEKIASTEGYIESLKQDLKRCLQSLQVAEETD